MANLLSPRSPNYINLKLAGPQISSNLIQSASKAIPITFLLPLAFKLIQNLTYLLHLFHVANLFSRRFHPSIQISSNRPPWRPWQLIQFRLIFPRRFLHPKAISSLADHAVLALSVGPKIRDSPCRTGYIGPVYQGSYYYLELTSCQV